MKMIEKQLKNMAVHSVSNINVKEEKINTTIEIAKESFYINQNMKLMTYKEFLFTQFKFIEKRWWLIQTFIMAVLLILLSRNHINTKVWKDAALLIPLFVIMIIPELWKSKRCQTIEIENTAYFPLRKIYSARMILFAMVDFVILNTFFIMASLTIKITIWDLIIQFVIPLLVTCCICFHVLCSKKYNSELTAVCLCLLWSAIWRIIILNKELYLSISKPLWILLIIVSSFYLCFIIKKTLKNCINDLEGDSLWN